MEKRKHYTIRLTKRQYALYKMLPYAKSVVYQKFLDKYQNKLEDFIRVYEQVKGIPPFLVGGKKSVVAPLAVKDRSTMEAFIGYLTLKLIESKGDVKRAYYSVKEDLGW